LKFIEQTFPEVKVSSDEKFTACAIEPKFKEPKPEVEATKEGEPMTETKEEEAEEPEKKEDKEESSDEDEYVESRILFAAMYTQVSQRQR